jgi:hypothetical protein
MELKIKFPGDISLEEEFGYTWEELSQYEKTFYKRYYIKKTKSHNPKEISKHYLEKKLLKKL